MATLVPSRITCVVLLLAAASAAGPGETTTVQTQNMQYRRAFTTSVTPLPGGRAVVMGMAGDHSGSERVEQFEPGGQQGGSYIRLPDAPMKLGLHIAILLADGRILVAGGTGDGEVSPSFHPDAGPNGMNFRSYVYDPVARTWTRAGDLPDRMLFSSAKSAVLLRDGRVMATGASRPRDAVRAPFTAAPWETESFNVFVASRQTLLFEPGTAFVNADGTRGVGRWRDLGERGFVPIAWTFRNHLPAAFALGVNIDTAAVPIPADMPGVRIEGGDRLLDVATNGFTLTVLADGKVLKTGGRHLFPSEDDTSSASAIFDPVDETWSPTDPLLSSEEITRIDGDYGDGSRVFHSALLLPDGRVLVVGGDTSNKTYMPPAPERRSSGRGWEIRNVHGQSFFVGDGRVLQDGMDVTLSGANPASNNGTFHVLSGGVFEDGIFVPRTDSGTVALLSQPLADEVNTTGSFEVVFPAMPNGWFRGPGEFPRRTCIVYDPGAPAGERWSHDPAWDLVGPRSGMMLVQSRSGAVYALAGHSRHDNIGTWTWGEPTIERFRGLTAGWGVVGTLPFVTKDVLDVRYNGLPLVDKDGHPLRGSINLALVAPDLYANGAILDDDRVLTVGDWNYFAPGKVGYSALSFLTSLTPGP